MPRLALVFLPLILALASSPQTHAAEGLILINQHKVNESGGFPYSITRAGSYRLTGNLEVPAGVDAIVIAASGVSLDLDGFAILGSAGGSAQSPGSAVSVTGAISQVSVTNGTILNFSVGANLGNCTLLPGRTYQGNRSVHSAYWRHFQSDRQQPRQLHHSQLPLPRHSRRLERPR